MIDHEMKEMLNVMSLPHSDKKKYQLRHENHLFGQTDTNFLEGQNKYFTLGFQGHINNLPELKDKLLENGQLVESSELVDLLITAFQTWGAEFLAFLKGSFTLFLFDKKAKTLLLARDKIGTHRVYWGRFEKTFVFASLLKGLLASKFAPQQPCMESIASYLYLGYFPQDKTPIQNLNCLLPGYYLILDSEHNTYLHKYWSFKKDSSPLTLKDTCDEMDHLLFQAVKRTSYNETQKACYLRGDLGSASLAYYLNKANNNPLLCCASSFEGEENSSSSLNEKIATQLGGSLESETLTHASLLEQLREMVWHLDEPVANPECLLIWACAKKMRGKASEVYTSLGCDEFINSQLVNTSQYKHSFFHNCIQFIRPFSIRFGVPLLDKINKRSAFAALRFFQKNFWYSNYVNQNALFNSSELMKIAPEVFKHFNYDIYLRQTYQYHKHLHSQKLNKNEPIHYEAETTLCNFSILQHQNIFKSENISVHSPFLDEDLFSFLIHMPESMKLEKDRSSTILESLMKENFNKENLQEHKQTHHDFLRNWFQNSTSSNVFEFITHGTLCESGLISKKELQKLFLHKKLSDKQVDKIWSILVLEIWFNIFINRPIHSYPSSNFSEETN
ncbi:MAG: putative asparagine synthetase [glutamine-hydrolyzing] [Chlamydiae bacterium]|nr:putative asparagine synthetase [glutamine-hydrolyzing] [Chlamydiota bacterium]